MRLTVLGSESTALCQIGALKRGFKALGHTLSIDWADPASSFVFVGNPPYESYLNAATRKSFIFNVLDVCPHCPDHQDILRRFAAQLPAASKVTTISKTVQAQLAALCGIKAEVIYYPMKPITCTRIKKHPYKVALIGRTSDPNKRCGAAVMALVRAGYEEKDVVIVGPEYPGWGTRLGTVTDEVLNEIYASVDYVMMLSREEGIGLPAIESACAGAIPIVLPDLSTYDEFWAPSPMHGFYKNLKSVDTVAALLTYLKAEPDVKEDLQLKMADYGNRLLRPAFQPETVAARIIEVYQSIGRYKL